MSTPLALPPALVPVVRLLGGAPFPWALAGGWALDLARGAVTRPHADVDLAVLRDDQAALRAYLRDWRWTQVVGGIVRPWRADEALRLPVHELHATPPHAAPGPALEFLLNECAGTDWVYRRDARVRLPLARAVVDAAGGACRILAPEIVLLYKAMAPRAVDEADFAAFLPTLSAAARAWLASALDVVHPGHAWRRALRDATWT